MSTGHNEKAVTFSLHNETCYFLVNKEMKALALFISGKGMYPTHV